MPQLPNRGIGDDRIDDAGTGPWLNLVALNASADLHIIATAARTGTDIELRIHTSLTSFDVAAEP